MIYRMDTVKESWGSRFWDYVKEFAKMLLYTIGILIFLWLFSGGGGPVCTFLAGCN